MDRRTFLTGIGTLGAAASATSALVSTETSAANARAAGLQKAARGGSTTAPPPATPPSTTPRTATKPGVAVATLASGPTVLAAYARGADTGLYAKKLGWSAWNGSPNGRSMLLPRGGEAHVSVSVGAFQAGATRTSRIMVKAIDVTAFFAIDGGQFVPFFAWSHRAAGRSSPALTFDAFIPDRVALQVDYVLDENNASRTLASTGSVYLPVGSAGGPDVGVYALAFPSHTSGLMPDLSACTFSGDVERPVLGARGAAPDFDHLAVFVRPFQAA